MASETLMRPINASWYLSSYFRLCAISAKLTWFQDEMHISSCSASTGRRMHHGAQFSSTGSRTAQVLPQIWTLPAMGSWPTLNQSEPTTTSFFPQLWWINTYWLLSTTRCLSMNGFWTCFKISQKFHIKCHLTKYVYCNNKITDSNVCVWFSRYSKDYSQAEWVWKWYNFRFKWLSPSHSPKTIIILDRLVILYKIPNCKFQIKVLSISWTSFLLEYVAFACPQSESCTAP